MSPEQELLQARHVGGGERTIPRRSRTKLRPPAAPATGTTAARRGLRQAKAKLRVMASSPYPDGGPRRPGDPISLPADHIEPRRLFAFLCMVFGMFMAILDIQIVSASLTEIQAGLAAQLERDHLGADVLSDRRGDHDPAVGLSVARARHAHPVRASRPPASPLASLMCGLVDHRSTR